MELILALLALGVVLPILYTVVQYNALTALRNHIRESWSDVDTELQRRHDLIPRLISVVKGYAAHESETLTKIARIRADCLAKRGDISALAGAEAVLEREVRQLLVTIEAYPRLKADTHFLELQRELIRTEDRIQAARRFYNGNVRDYLNKCQSFPSMHVAAAFGFDEATYFSAEEGARRAPAYGRSR